MSAPTLPYDPVELRRKAEELAGTPIDQLPPHEELLRIVHESRVHRIELELQNDELRRLGETADVARDHALDLFNEAPFGYLRVDGDGRIHEVNRTAGRLFQLPEEKLVGRFLAQFIAPDDVEGFRMRFRAFFNRPEDREIEVTMRHEGGAPFVARISGRRSMAHDDKLFLTIEDITVRHRALEAVEAAAIANASVAVLAEDALDPAKTLDQLAARFLEEARRLTNAEHGFVGYIDERTRELVSTTLTAMFGDACRMTNPNVRFPVDEQGRYPALFGAPLNERRAVLANDPAAHPASRGIPEGHVPLENFLGVPAMAGGTPVGLIALSNKKGGFTEDDLTVIRRLAVLLSATIQRQRAETVRRRLSRAIEQSTASIVITDREGRIEYANPRAAETTGYSPEELLGANPRVLKSGEMSPEGYQDLWSTISAGEDWRGEFQNRRKDGSLYWESAVISPITDEKGAITHFVAIKDDITERKRIEAQLRESEEQFRQITENLKDVVWLRSADNDRMLFISPAFEEVWGRARQSLYDDPSYFTEAVHPDDREAVAAEYANYQETGNFDLEYRIVRPDGVIRWIHARGYPIRDMGGGVIRHSGLATDITERKRYEEQLRESEENQRRLFDLGHDAILVAEVETGIIIDANAAALMMVGRNRENLIGRHQSEIHPPTKVDFYRRTFGEATATESYELLEAEVVDANGRMIPVEISTSVFSLNDGRRVIQGLFRDITERKRLEEERFSAIEREAMLGRLASSVAHEVNNPLYAIKMQVESLRRKLDDPAQVEKINLVRAQVDRIARTVKALLGLARAPAGGSVALDLAETLRGIMLLYEVGFISRNIGVHLDFADDLPSITAQGDRIQQVFINLLENARHAIGEGGTVAVMLRRKGETIEATIEDDGPGFTVEPETLFAPTYSTRAGGTGLGLAITRRIVEEHGGRITAENRAEGGARFRVVLPIGATRS